MPEPIVIHSLGNKGQMKASKGYPWSINVCSSKLSSQSLEKSLIFLSVQHHISQKSRKVVPKKLRKICLEIWDLLHWLRISVVLDSLTASSWQRCRESSDLTLDQYEGCQGLVKETRGRVVVLSLLPVVQLIQIKALGQWQVMFLFQSISAQWTVLKEISVFQSQVSCAWVSDTSRAPSVWTVEVVRGWADTSALVGAAEKLCMGSEHWWAWPLVVPGGLKAHMPLDQQSQVWRSERSSSQSNAHIVKIQGGKRWGCASFGCVILACISCFFPRRFIYQQRLPIMVF